MAAISFPSSPSLNQIYIYKNNSFKWNGKVWLYISIQSNIYSTNDFGAVGDGVTDDTAAVNAALTAASATNVKRIFVYGNSKLSSNIAIPDNVEVFGGTFSANTTTTKITMGTGSTIAEMNLIDTCVEVPYNKNDVRLSDNIFQFNQNKINIDQAVILKSQSGVGPSRTIIERNRKSGGGSIPFVIAEIANDSEFSENYWENTDVTISGCYVTPGSNTATGTLTTTGSPSLDPNSNTRVFLSDGTYIGLITAKLSGGTNSWTIERRTSENLSSYVITSRSNVTIRASSLLNSGVTLYGGSRNNIMNNTFVGGRVGVLLAPNSSRTPITDNIITGNTIKDINDEGISITSLGDVASSNTVSASFITTKSSTVVANGSPNTITVANTISNTVNAVSGLVATFLSGTLIGKSYKITSSTTNTITLGDDFPGNSIGTNVALNDVVTIENDIRRNKIIGNNINECGTYGINLSGSGTDTLIDNNTTYMSNITNYKGVNKFGINVSGLATSYSNTKGFLGNHPVSTSIPISAINPYNVIISNNKHTGLSHLNIGLSYPTNYTASYMPKGATIIGNRGGYCHINAYTGVVEQTNDWLGGSAIYGDLTPTFTSKDDYLTAKSVTISELTSPAFTAVQSTGGSLRANQYYYFHVSCMDLNGNITNGYSDAFNEYGTAVTTTSTNRTINVSWNAVPGAAAYIVWVSFWYDGNVGNSAYGYVKTTNTSISLSDNSQIIALGTNGISPSTLNKTGTLSVKNAIKVGATSNVGTAGHVLASSGGGSNYWTKDVPSASGWGYGYYEDGIYYEDYSGGSVQLNKGEGWFGSRNDFYVQDQDWYGELILHFGSTGAQWDNGAHLKVNRASFGVSDSGLTHAFNAGWHYDNNDWVTSVWRYNESGYSASAYIQHNDGNHYWLNDSSANSGVAGQTATLLEKMQLNRWGDLAIDNAQYPDNWNEGGASFRLKVGYITLTGARDAYWRYYEGDGSPRYAYLLSNAHFDSTVGDYGSWIFDDDTAAFSKVSLYEFSNGGHIFYRSSSAAYAGDAITMYPSMTIDSLGRVGINTTVPEYALHVNGAARFEYGIVSYNAVGATTTNSWDSSRLQNILTFTIDANNRTIPVDSGSPPDGTQMIVRIRSGASAYTGLSFATGSKSFRAVSGVTLPTATLANKTIYMRCIYNLADSYWDVLSVQQNA